MRVRLVFLEVPGAREAFGGERFELEMEGRTVEDLLQTLINRFGPRAEEVLTPGGDTTQPFR